ncbi:YidH family protein [Novosphingopyxis sp.]|uniref:YidH family protein n=1 Tax=Novosphingopyxis sp. TaxID=2709690 RepID=UPI003B599421
MADKDKTTLAGDRTDYAEDRTEFAEDRTIMANERTFAGWMRTGLAAVGVGLGFNALFDELEPWWLPRLAASMLIMSGIAIFFAAQRKGCNVYERLDAHSAAPIGGMNLKLIATALSVASMVLLVGVWMLPL